MWNYFIYMCDADLFISSKGNVLFSSADSGSPGGADPQMALKMSRSRFTQKLYTKTF